MPIILPDLPASLLFAQERTIGEDLVGTAIVVGVGILVYWIALVLGRRYVNRMTMKGGERGARATTLWTVLRRVVLVAVLFTVVLFVFTLWDWSITPFLGLGTVIAAAVGFGAQDLVKDFLAGFFILMEDQFHVGDTVTIAGVTGTVEDIQLRVTLLRDLEGNQHFVPNGQITVTSNFTSGLPMRPTSTAPWTSSKTSWRLWPPIRDSNVWSSGPPRFWGSMSWENPR
jgi:small-conductance mechanosensitive channel